MKNPSVFTTSRPWASLLRESILPAAALLLATCASASPLQEKIQKELDASPFLAAQKLAMHVLSERQGAVTLELTEGPQKLRDMFRRGYELNSSALAEVNLEPDVVQALRSIRRTVHVIKKVEGVQEISLTGALSSAVVPAATPSPSPTGTTTSALLEQIQKELDSSPFLASQQLKMRVLSERRGNVNLELTEGPNQLRDMFRRGYELNSSALAEAHFEPDVVQALRSVRRTLTVIKGLNGVKEISLTGAITPSLTPTEPPPATPSPQRETGALEKQIQEKLDTSTFLAGPQVKMRVLNEKAGTVSLEVTDGPKKLRDMLRKGYDINGDGLGETDLKQEVIKALRNIKRIVTVVKGMPGVKEVTLTGAIDTVKDRAENFYDEAAQKISQNGSQVGPEALALLNKSAELGFLRAQTDLAKIYMQGVDLRPEEEKAAFWLRKAAAQGDAPSQFQLATRYTQGLGVEKNYAEAIAWYQKAIRQNLDADIRTRSQLALASLLATCPVERLRDGNAALEYAKKGIAAAPNGIAIETLASAYARCGQFEEAIEQQKKWIKQLEDATFMGDEEKKGLLSTANDRLQVYLKYQPYTAPE